MPMYFQLTQYDVSHFRKNWGWILFWGIALVLLGVMAMSATVFTTLISVIFLGAVLFASAVIMMLNTFQYWLHKPGFFSHFLVSLLYMIAGLTLMFTPIPAAFSLTVIMAVFFIVIGFFRIIFAAATQLPSWGWSFLSGLVTLALGILILSGLPSSGFYMIGLFVGIDLFIWGWAFIMLSILAKGAKA
ncbi:MAG: DUF308 domain-containing protein [Proteobacteria bacterium]|nr:DUF308 domain-containing protein [Pseudomonadota bacterium]